ncbi:E3 ubiquitin-protein ligase Midline-1-like [Teleopsis dalmanni]|uniref:E3 ubiquitin-protein ligase Midline-1-like n=1 Tax=Teleopsis dalmanni TaxID=139649 RepID=UPI0018CFEA82|nr:E3 ubiquitin-protein ligase Midline-1-like [Teleopsis dalmanni]
MTELCTFQSNDAQYTNFIRNSIKNFYKCPKCRSQFSVKRNNETNKRLRPYILPCKHTVCESCIIKNIRCFECPVCLKPVLFPKFRINIREYIELDFYLLGYLYYFDLLDENKEAIVLREISQKAIAPKPTQKCSECERQTAYGKCLHCKAFFCTSCFTQVHATSKVLRSHRLDRITSDEFNLYVPNRCYAHHNVINYICITCDEELCKTCRRLTDHEDHDVKRIFEENQLHQDDITHMLESLKRFDEVLAKSEKVSKYTFMFVIILHWTKFNIFKINT